jgi:anti-sigma28 factor (negative regulator of flagellin synthesis)
MKYAQESPQELSRDYPYVAHDQTCKFSESQGKVRVSGVGNVPKGSVEQLKAAIADGPVSVTVQAD